MYPNFKPKEFECHCTDPECKKDGMEFFFLAALQDLRFAVGFPLLISSGYRCQIMNKVAGGRPDSFHLKGLACDILIKDMSSGQKHRLLRKALGRFNGVGIYPHFVHLDLRPPRDKAVWIGH
jgi:uncharacterized protein YcbK (DUF882 family)